MPRYVILRHECPPGYARPSHWDLMLERAAALQTWALPESPDSLKAMIAEALGDHRADYLTYEGPISEDPVSEDPVSEDPVSKDRGTVSRWDEGTYTLERDDPSLIVVVLDGEKLVGRVELRQQTDDRSRWRYVYSVG